MFSLIEIFYIFIGIFVASYIFNDYFRGSFKQRMKTSLIVVGSSIFLHELAHKLVALSFGYQASFGISLFWLSLALILKFANSPILFFVPAFVTIYAPNPIWWKMALISIAGPLANLLLYLISSLLLLRTSNVYRFYIYQSMRKINFFLFVFNLIPFPGSDGFNFLRYLIFKT